MPDSRVHHYTNGELTVHWKPGICQHTGICARGLPAVFSPRRRPWIDMTAASTDEIEAQVHRCPSGALTCERRGA